MSPFVIVFMARCLFPSDTINRLEAKGAKSVMNARALQAKNAILADDARSKVFSLEKELLATMYSKLGSLQRVLTIHVFFSRKTRDELMQLKESELDLDLSNVARIFGIRNVGDVIASLVR